MQQRMIYKENSNIDQEKHSSYSEELHNVRANTSQKIQCHFTKVIHLFIHTITF